MLNLIRTYFRLLHKMPNKELFPEGTEFPHWVFDSYTVEHLDLWVRAAVSVPPLTEKELTIPKKDRCVFTEDGSRLVWSFSTRIRGDHHLGDWIGVYEFLPTHYYVEIIEQCHSPGSWYPCQRQFWTPHVNYAHGEPLIAPLDAIKKDTSLTAEQQVTRIMRFLDTINGAHLLWVRGLLPAFLARWGWEEIKE